MAIISTLSEINAVLTSTYHGILQQIDTRWVNPYQTVFSSLEEWESVKEAYFKASRKVDIELPFAALVRSPQVLEVDQMGGYRQWDGTWIDASASPTSGTVSSVTARGITLQYELNIYDSRMETAEALIQGFILQGNPKNQSIDFTSDLLGCTSRVSFVGGIPYYKRLPSKEDRKRGSGYLYQLGIPIKVNGIIGTSSNAARILEVQANIYSRIYVSGNVPPDQPINPEMEGDHVSITWDSSSDKFIYTWTGD